MKNKLVNLNKKQKEILIGSMLGDGFIDKSGLKFVIGRCQKDKKYLIWEYEFFKNICPENMPRCNSVFDDRTNKYYHRVSFYTRHNDVFIKYRDKWYPNGKKIVPKDLVLTPLICAVWFADDGYCRFIKNRSLEVRLSSEGFDEKYVNLLIEKLKKYLKVKDVNFVFKGMAKDGHKKLTIILGAIASTVFINKIKKYLIQMNMQRKITWDQETLNKFGGNKYKNTIRFRSNSEKKEKERLIKYFFDMCKKNDIKEFRYIDILKFISKNHKFGKNKILDISKCYFIKTNLVPLQKIGIINILKSNGKENKYIILDI